MKNTYRLSKNYPGHYTVYSLDKKAKVLGMVMKTDSGNWIAMNPDGSYGGSGIDRRNALQVLIGAITYS